MLALRFVIPGSVNPNLIFFRFAFIFFAGFSLFCSIVSGNPVRVIEQEEGSPQDTVIIRKGRYIILKTISINIPRDTFYIVNHEKSNRTEAGSYQNSKIFFDTVHEKFSRKKITQLLYNLAFVEPKQSDLPDSMQILKSATPFEEYNGKVIRSISIKILPPFGASVYDTGRNAGTGIGKALNSVHMNTRKYVVRRNLLFKNGDRVNPATLADNERVLRNLTAIDNARIIVTQVGPDSDSVDLIVVAKDVWSIGLDVPVITPQYVRFRIYDANFLGLGDQLINNMSIDLFRAPFFIFEGLTYSYSNIGGSLINGTIGYVADNIGNRSLLLRFDRSFLTNQTKWAGGAIASYETYVNELADTNSITSYFNNAGLWLGKAFLLKGQRVTSRAVLAAAVYRKDYVSRPFVTIDSNRSYYNQLQVLTTFSISRNNYYLTDYVLDFGKTENLPYGHLLQLTIGADRCDFYTRLYSGINLSAGNFFDKFGYISAYLKFSGFFNNSSFEDAVFKFNLQYFTPLLKTTDKRYKFRTFYTIDFRCAINSRSNNLDYYDANLNFKIDKVGNTNYFNAVNILSGRLSSVCFTPWYFYGFRFAIMVELQTGLISKKKEPLLKSPLFSSIGLSIIIKNDNLVFPAFLISGYYYPSSVGDFSQLQFILGSNLNVQYYDFNVNAPHEENLGN
ncbi:MAG: hypothetical protein WCK84_13110 [Bacteroidota bacterium]